MLEVIFLGTNGSVQEKEGGGNTSLLLKTGKTTLLIDTSTNLQEAVKAEVDGVVITHDHIDHMYGLPSLLHQLWLTGRKKELIVFAPESICPMVEDLINLFRLREKKAFFPLSVKKAEDGRFGDLDLAFFKTDHTSDSLGLLASNGGKRLLYTADTRPIGKGEEAWKNVDLLIHEASGTKEEEETLIKKGHSSGRDAALLAIGIQAGKLLLCHLPASSKKEEILKEASEVFKATKLPIPLRSYVV